MNKKDKNASASYIDVSDRVLSRADMAETFGYYAQSFSNGEIVKESNVSSSDRPLIVNCAGNFASSFPFTTDRKNGRHDFMLVYVNAGTLTFYDKNKQIETGAGNIIILPPDTPHKYSSSGDGKLSYFWVHFTGGEANERLREYDLATFPTVYESVLGNHIHQRFQSVFDSFSKRDAFIERELSALLERLLITVSRSVIRGEKAITLSKSVKYIGANYSADIRIAELAELEHLSVSRYNYLFKDQMGMPPTKFILRLRMSSAKELLSSTDLPVKQIGIMCGYPDPHFFSKVFKGFFGISPAEYRKGFGV